jgi:RND family efflux transporter MFP subunit
MKKSVRRVITGVVVLAIGGAAFTLLKGPPPKAVAVDTAPVELIDLRSVTSATGSVQPTRQIALSFASTGKVSVLNVEPGQVVTAGTVIAELDSTSAAIEVKTKQAALNEALAKAQSLRQTATAADRAVYDATVAAAQSSAAQAAKAKGQLSEVNNASATQAQEAIGTAASQQERDAATLATDSARQDDAQNKLNADTAAKVEAKTFLEVAKANLAIAQRQRDVMRDQLAKGRQDSAALGLTRDEAQRALDKATADYERLRASIPAVDASGNPVIVAVSDAPVVAARTNANAAAARVAANDADIVRTQGMFDVAVDAVGQAERDLSSAQTKYDTLDATVTSSKAAVEAARAKVEGGRESLAKSGDQIKSAKAAKTAGARRDDQAMITAENSRIAAEAAARTAERERRQKQQGSKPSDIRAALASVDAAAASLELSRDTLEKTQLKAPFDGVIATVGFKQGEQVGTSTGALGSTATKDAGVGTIVLVDTSAVLIRLPLPEVDAAKVADGQSATVTFDSLGDTAKPVEAKVQSVEPTPTLVNGVSTYNARIAISQAPKGVRLGMTASVEVLLGVRKQVLTVPAEALSEKDGATQVSVVTVDAKKRQIITQVSVAVGDRADGRVEITKGLKRGDLVKMPLPAGGAK